MTPAEHAVVEAAIQVVADAARGFYPTSSELKAAVEALQAERAAAAAGGPAPEEDLTYGDAMIGDEIYSEITKKWYPVLQAVHGYKPGISRVFIKGIKKPVETSSTKPLKIRRGQMAKDVEAFTVLWSGLTAPEHVTDDESPMLGESEEL